MANSDKQKREMRWNFWRNYSKWSLLMDTFDDRLKTWESKLACLDEELRSTVSTALANLDMKALIDGVEYGENYFDPPKLDALTSISMGGDSTIEEKATFFEVATLVWAQAGEIVQLNELYRPIHPETVEAFVFATDLASFWTSKGETKETIKEKHLAGIELISPEKLREWLRYYGGPTLSQKWSGLPKGNPK